MKTKKICLIILLLSVLLGGCTTTNNNEFQSTTLNLPTHLYNMSSECIAYTYNQYVYDFASKQGIGKYDSDKKIFIDKNGRYLGEIVNENLLLKNTNSKYYNILLGTQPTIPTAPTPSTPPTRATVPTMASNWKDIYSNNTSLDPLPFPNITKQSFNLNILKEGKGSVSGAGVYKKDAQVTVSASESYGYYFYGWIINDQIVEDAIYTFNMPANDLSITAIFYEKQQYTLTLLKTGDGSVLGTMNLTSLLKSKKESFYEDESITLVAYPSSNSIFDGWYVLGKLVTNDTILQFDMLQRSFTIEARFVKI